MAQDCHCPQTPSQKFSQETDRSDIGWGVILPPGRAPWQATWDSSSLLESHRAESGDMQQTLNEVFQLKNHWMTPKVARWSNFCCPEYAEPDTSHKISKTMKYFILNVTRE